MPTAYGSQSSVSFSAFFHPLFHADNPVVIGVQRCFFTVLKNVAFAVAAILHRDNDLFVFAAMSLNRYAGCHFRSSRLSETRWPEVIPA